METLDLGTEGEEPPEEPASSPLRLLLYGIVAVVLVGLGSLLIANGTDATQQQIHPVPTLSPTPPIESQPILLDRVCPARTDHRNYLIVSFLVKNVRGTAVRVAAMAGHPPLGGVTQARPTRSGGTCRRPGRAPVRSVIASGGNRLYTIRWDLPDTCPEPYPLQVRVTYQLPGEVVMKSDFVTVLVDLSGIGFLQCPKAVTDLPTPLGDG